MPITAEDRARQTIDQLLTSTTLSGYEIQTEKYGVGICFSRPYRCRLSYGCHPEPARAFCERCEGSAFREP